jgi:hypothetical protein
LRGVRRSLTGWIIFIEHIFYKRVIPLGLNTQLNFIPSVGGVSEGRGGFSFLGVSRSLTGWIIFIEHIFYKRVIPLGLNTQLNFIPSIGGVSAAV